MATKAVTQFEWVKPFFDAAGGRPASQPGGGVPGEVDLT